MPNILYSKLLNPPSILEFNTEHQQSIQKGDNGQYSCVVCAGSFNLEEIAALDTCFHFACTKDMRRYLGDQINDRNKNAKCMECQRLIEENEIRRICTSEMHAKYTDFKLKRLVSTEEDTRWCLKPGCGNAMTVPDATNPHTSCNSCGFSFCATCRCEWHLTCDAYQRVRQVEAEEKANVDLINATTKGCPFCGTRITHYKNHGCHHIKPGSGCTICKGHFCYVCLQKWRTCDCPNNCFDDCGCPLCSDCKPGRRCDDCDVGTLVLGPLVAIAGSGGCPSCML